ncbi:hypothetical protein SAMN05421807_11817 [Virgibacillus chiguensis]|uniref:Uncharacterized protein n=1 Tax=Virgibacillus chiguensis TaxID=411959 RepID=A0A1M5WQ84_9BACI|nr:hypothetical protein SAMN05421807_11817 [Virgibacillus chiguensis]
MNRSEKIIMNEMTYWKNLMIESNQTIAFFG